MGKFKVIETSRFLDKEGMGEIKGGAPFNPGDVIIFCTGLVDHGVVRPCDSGLGLYRSCGSDFLHNSCGVIAMHNIGTCYWNYFL